MLRLLMAGDGRKEIAARLAMSPHTVKTHLSRIYLKLDVQSAHQAVALALRSPQLRRVVASPK